MKKTMTAIALACVICLASISFGFDGILDNTLNYYKDNKSLVFVSKCKGYSNDRKQNYSAVFLVDIGAKRVRLFEFLDSSIVNAAFFSYNNGGLYLGETHGGMYTRNRVYNLGNEMLAYEFVRLSNFSVKELLEMKTDNTCKNID